MANRKGLYFTTPPGRLVWGSLVKPKTKDRTGNLLLIKKGADAGKPTQKFEFGVAIPKGAELDWKQTSWGQLIYAEAVDGFPNGVHASPTFSWKVIDGDSTIPNSSGVVPCTRQGWAKCWVLSFSTSYAPEVLDATGANRIDPAQVKLGYVVQVAGSVVANLDAVKPGVYLNHKFVSFQWTDTEIINGPDPSTLGFGQHQAPTGASPHAQGSFAPPANVTPPPPGATPPPPPHTDILKPPAPTGPVMTPKAGAKNYGDFITAGWKHEQLVQHGYVTA